MTPVPGTAAGTIVETALTLELGSATIASARSLLDEVCNPETTDHDWEHCLGGQHALLWEDQQLVAHAAVVGRRLTIGGRRLRAGYVEATVAHEYDLGALGSTDVAVGFYVARGWRAWQGPTWVRTPNGLMRTADEDGWIYLLETGAALDFSDSLSCEWRPGDVW